MAAKDTQDHKPSPVNKENLRDATINAAIPTAATVAGDLLAPGFGGIAGSFLGSFFAGMVGSMVNPTIETRAAEWYRMVENGLKELQEKRSDVNLDDPATREAFTSTILEAIPAALRTSQEEKRRLLRNAVLNSVLPNPPDEDKLLLFLRLTAELTVSHLHLLEYFVDPRAYIRRYLEKEIIEWASGLEELYVSIKPNFESDYDDLAGIRQTFEGQAQNEFWDNVFPQWADERSFRNTLIRDLYTNNLIHTNQFSGIRYIRTITRADRYATNLGARFLSFITDPLK